jgi:hypothetical protein
MNGRIRIRLAGKFERLSLNTLLDTGPGRLRLELLLSNRYEFGASGTLPLAFAFLESK